MTSPYRVRGIDPAIWKTFRSYCVRHGLKTGDEVNRAIELYLRSREQQQQRDRLPESLPGMVKVRRDVVERIQALRKHILESKYLDVEDPSLRKEWYRVGEKTFFAWLQEALSKMDERSQRNYWSYLRRLGFIRLVWDNPSVVEVSGAWLVPRVSESPRQDV